MLFRKEPVIREGIEAIEKFLYGEIMRGFLVLSTCARCQLICHLLESSFFAVLTSDSK